ncbi:hypothetical protein [Undibacterium sp. Ren11W]|uniref:hypothetical protein n=1 Tax=Undibacterium sp. Ren11W TaxID=3413045 RepID=UPI003BF4AA6C
MKMTAILVSRYLRIPVLCALILSASACASYSSSSPLRNGPGVDSISSEIETYRKNQDEVWNTLVKLSKLPENDTSAKEAPSVPATPLAALTPGLDYDLLVQAGMNHADNKCKAYMDALFRLNRDKRTSVAQLGLIGTAAAGLMAAVESSAKSVSIVAILFGLASSTVDNLSSNLLYDLDPSSVQTLVNTLQSSYRDELKSGYKTRPAVINAIGAYARLCVPSNIEAEINLAVKKAQPKVEKGDPASGRAPVVTNAITTAYDRSYQSDDNAELLRNFIFPNGSIDNAAKLRLEAYLQARDIKSSVVGFYRGASPAERAEAVQFFKLTK